MSALPEAFRPIRTALARVEAELNQRTHGKMSVFGGGKRLRPALLLFAAHAFDGQGSGPQAPGRSLDDAVTAASALEMVHTASLIHDDIVDGATERRNVPALHRLLGVKPAVVLADYLFVQGLAMLETVRATGVQPRVVREVRIMCEGQLAELAAGPAAAEQDYLRVIEKKTASFFACCCSLGGLFRGAGPEELELLEVFGRTFGFVYQLLDDARDLQTGIASPLDAGIVARGGREYCRRLAGEYAEQARATVARLVDEEERRGLGQTLSYICEVDRGDGNDK